MNECMLPSVFRIVQGRQIYLQLTNRSKENKPKQYLNKTITNSIKWNAWDGEGD